MNVVSVNPGFVLLSEREIYQGPIIRLVEAQFATPNGETMTRVIVRHRGAVGVVPVDAEEVLLVRQYRAPLDAEILEIPAGLREDESPETTAQRELAEEVGFIAETLEPLGGFYNSVGFCDEFTHLFLATDLRPVPRAPDGPEESHMAVERMAVGSVQAAIDAGEFVDAKTIIALQGALRRLGVEGRLGVEAGL